MLAQRLDVFPNMLSRVFQPGEGAPPAGEIKPERDHEQPGDQSAHRQNGAKGDRRDLGADQTGNGPGHRVAQDSSGAVREMVGDPRGPRSPAGLRQAGVEGADDTAAHPDAMSRAQKSNRQRGEKRKIHRHPSAQS